MALVGILIPFGEGGRPSELQRYIQIMQNATPQHMFTFVEVDLMIIGKARNMLVETTLSGTEADVFWFIDRDTFPPAHAGQLIDQCLDLGIVSGLYFSRRLPYTPQAYTLATEPENQGAYWPLLEYPESGLMVVDAVGGGMLTVRRDIFLQMKEYYDARMTQALRRMYDMLDRHGDVEARRDFEWLIRYARKLSPWFEFLDRKGEDLYFCERARDAGHMIWLNVDVKCAHRGEIDITEQHFLHLRDSGAIQKVEPVSAPGADELKVFGAEDDHEDIAVSGPGPEALERGDDLSRTPRRLGVMYNLPGT